MEKNKMLSHMLVNLKCSLESLLVKFFFIIAIYFICGKLNKIQKNNVYRCQSFWVFSRTMD